MKYYSICFIVLLWHGIAASDPIDRIAGLIRAGDIKGLSEFFAPNVDVTLLQDENIYSRTQAALILEHFFAQNKPRSVKILHKINSSRNYRFGVLLVNTDNGIYRVAFTLKGSDDGLLLIEFRIETGKVK